MDRINHSDRGNWGGADNKQQYNKGSDDKKTDQDNKPPAPQQKNQAQDPSSGGKARGGRLGPDKMQSPGKKEPSSGGSQGMHEGQQNGDHSRVGPKDGDGDGSKDPQRGHDGGADGRDGRGSENGKLSPSSDRFQSSLLVGPQHLKGGPESLLSPLGNSKLADDPNLGGGGLGRAGGKNPPPDGGQGGSIDPNPGRSEVAPPGPILKPRPVIVTAPPPGPQATDGDTLLKNYENLPAFKALNDLKVESITNYLATRDTSFITPDSINHLEALGKEQKLALLGQYLKFKSIVPQIGQRLEKNGAFIENQTQIGGSLDAGIAKLEADPEVAKFFQEYPHEVVPGILRAGSDAGTMQGLKDNYKALITDGGLLAEAKRDGLSLTETMKAYDKMAGELSAYLPPEYLNQTGVETQETLMTFLGSAGQDDPGMYDRLVAMSLTDPNPPPDILEVFKSVDGPNGALYAKAWGGPLAAVADQIVADIPPDQLSVTRDVAVHKVLADLVKMASQSFQQIRNGSSGLMAYNDLNLAATQDKMDFGKSFLKAGADPNIISKLKSGAMHGTNAFLNGLTLAASALKDNKSLAQGNPTSVAGLLGASMSLTGQMGQSLFKNLRYSDSIFSDDFKNALAKRVPPKALENGSKVLGALGGLVSAALGFTNAVASGKAGDIPGAVLNSASASVGVIGSAEAIAEAVVYFGGDAALAVMARAMGVAVGSAIAAEEVAMGLEAISGAAGLVGLGLGLALMAYDFAKMIQAQKKIDKEFDDKFNAPLKSLTGQDMNIIFPSNSGGW